jgi:hypothetical protein
LKAMADEVKQVDYFYVTITDKPGEGARILTAFRDAGVNLLGFCGFPQGARKAQLDFVPQDPAMFVKAARRARISISEKKRAFLIQGDERPGVISQVVNRLAEPVRECASRAGADGGTEKKGSRR